MSNAPITADGSASGASSLVLPARPGGPGDLLVLAVYTPLVAYLFRAAQNTGDGAAYTLQALGAEPLDRAVHAGWLLPLAAWTRALTAAGIDPSAATNAASALATGVALVGLVALGRELAGRRSDALLAPAVALCSAAVWDGAVFCEIYAPLAALCVGAVLALRTGRSVAAAALLFLALATHPGALALLPGLFVLGTPPGRVAGSVRAGALTAAIALGWVALLGPGAWLGPRGVLAAGADVTPWTALQRAYRVLARDLGVASLPLLVGALAVWSRRSAAGLRWLGGCTLLLAGTVLGLDRFSDNPAALPLLLLCCPLAAAAPSALRALPSRAARGALALTATVLVLGVAEATTRQDAVVRAATRARDEARRSCEGAGPPPESSPRWRERMLLELACAPGS